MAKRKPAKSAKKRPAKRKESVANRIRRIRRALAARSKTNAVKKSGRKKGWAKADYLAFAKYWNNFDKAPFSQWSNFDKAPFSQWNNFLNFVKRVP